jgi:hypothetical protein
MGASELTQIQGVPGSIRNNVRKSIIHDEKIMKVAQVYAMGSLSPGLQRHVRQQQQQAKLRELSLGSNNTALFKHSNVAISLSNVRLPQLANKYNVVDHLQQQQD